MNLEPLWVLELPCATPSANAFVNKLDPRTYQRIRRQWERTLRDAWYLAKIRRAFPEQFRPPARARLTIYRSSPQPIDPDNLIGGLKPVIDALRRLELIADDDPASLALTVRPSRAPTSGTRLVLEPWPLEAA